MVEIWVEKRSGAFSSGAFSARSFSIAYSGAWTVKEPA